jgi:hypothetical protein
MNNDINTDLTYLKTGFFTVFFPQTKEGEEAYNEMCYTLGNNSAKILTRDLKNVLSQLKKAGYKVRKQKKSKLKIDDILNELDF